MIISDTGAIIGFLDRSDQHHKWAVEQWKKLPAPFVTCEAVITEACYLVRHLPEGEREVLTLVEAGILRLDFSLANEVTAIKEIVMRYDNVPMSLADACLVRLSEMIKDSSVFTLDSDFWIYRRNGSEQIPLIIPKK